MIIKNGSILITDVHYHKNFRDKYFIEFLDLIEKNLPTQIILMGDIFDLLFGGVEYTENQNRDIITRLNLIGNKIEIIYLEGNHDFNLKSLFPNLKIIPIEQQPCKFIFNNDYNIDEVFEKKIDIYLAHGDWNINGMFKYYRKIISNSKVLKILNYIDIIIDNMIIKNIELRQTKKNKCFKIKDFVYLINHRLQLLNLSNGMFLEGHFHQGNSFDFKELKYINLKSFACSKSYFIVKSKGHSLYLEEKSL